MSGVSVLVLWIDVVGVGGGGNTLPMGRGWLLLTMLGWCGRVLSIYECG